MFGPLALLLSGAAAGAAAALLLNGGGEGARATLKDATVTALKLAQMAGRRAAEAAEAVEDFVAEVAHDLAGGEAEPPAAAAPAPRREPDSAPKPRRKRTSAKAATPRTPKPKREDKGG